MNKSLRNMKWDDMKAAGAAVSAAFEGVAAEPIAIVVLSIPGGVAQLGQEVDIRGLTSPNLPLSEVVGMMETFTASLRAELDKQERGSYPVRRGGMANGSSLIN